MKHCSKCKTELPEGRKLNYCRDCFRPISKKGDEKRKGAARHRKCAYCGVELEKPQVRATCNPCSTAYNKAYRKANPDKARQFEQTKWARHGDRYNAKRRTPEHREKDRARQRERYAEDPNRFINKEAVYRAQKAGCKVSKVELQGIVEAAQGRCQFCGVYTEGRTRTFDHIIPLSKGGEHAKSNLQLLCLSCNCRKSDRLIEELDWAGRDSSGQLRLENSQRGGLLQEHSSDPDEVPQ